MTKKIDTPYLAEAKEEVLRRVEAKGSKRSYYTAAEVTNIALQLLASGWRP